jgi:hypothetical protein
MGDLTGFAQSAFAGGLRASASTGLDQLEQAVADMLSQIQPGRTSAALIHDDMQRLVLINELLLKLSPKVPPWTVADVVRRQRPSRVIRKAQEKTAKAYEEALLQAGIPSSVLELLQSWVEVTVDVRFVHRQIELKRAMDSIQGGGVAGSDDTTRPDASALLSAAQLGKALGDLGDEIVRVRERAGELFSILRPGRKRGREYPAFQAWPGVAGQPLVRTLAALGPASSADAYSFFTSPTALLCGLTPVEALLGQLTSRTDSGVNLDAQVLLAAPPEERLKAVILAAKENLAY